MGRHALCERGIRRLGSREKGFFYRYPDSGDQSRPVAADGGDESRLVESLEEQVRYLRPQLDEAHRANAEHRRLLAAVLERVPALEAPPEPREASEAASERVGPEYEGRVAAEALRAALVAASVFLRTGVNAKTSLSVYSLTPIATLYGVLVGFFLTKVQGRSQTRYVKSAEYITKLRRFLLNVRWAFEVLHEYEHESADEIGETADEVGDRVIKLVSYYETYSP
jgi:hypothetical protein